MREDEEEDVSSYQMTFGIKKILAVEKEVLDRTLWRSLLEEATELKQDRLRNE
jgi:hypothetical protein